MPKIGRNQLICILLGLITLVLYWPVSHFEFLNFDDPEYITNNVMIHNGVTKGAVQWALQTYYASNWHPVTWISHMVDCGLFGADPSGHHLMNVLFHAFNAILLFLVLLHMTGATWRSGFVAALFAWHPLHVESVAWVSERKDVLSTFFLLLTIWAYAKYAQGSRNSGDPAVTPQIQPTKDLQGHYSFSGLWPSSFYLLSLAFFILALMSKPMAVTLPFLLLLLDYWPLNRFQKNATSLQTDKLEWLPLLSEKIPFLVLSVLDCLATVWAQTNDAIVGVGVLPLLDRFENALVSYLLYAWKTIWPTHLLVFYRYHSSPAALVIASGLILATVSAAAFFGMRHRPYLLVGWLWFLGTLVPVIGLVQVGAQAMADRYTYVPIIGLFIVLVWGACELLEGNPKNSLLAKDFIKRLSATCAIAITFLFILSTHAQLKYWQNSVALFDHVVNEDPGSLRAEYNLGQAFESHGEIEKAVIHYRRALRIAPSPVEAVRNWQDAAHINLGAILATQGRWDEAKNEFQPVVRGNPGLWQARGDLADCEAASGRLEEALQQYRIVLRLDDSSPEVWRRFGDTLLKSGKNYEAIRAFRKAVSLSPNGVLELNNLAWMLATDPHNDLRNGQEAIQLAQRACELTQWQEPRCLGTLDAAYAETGRFQEAITTAELTRRTALMQGQQTVATLAAARLELYRTKRCYRQD